MALIAPTTSTVNPPPTSADHIRASGLTASTPTPASIAITLSRNASLMYCIPSSDERIAVRGAGPPCVSFRGAFEEANLFLIGGKARHAVTGRAGGP
jgi:hypothetical protein